MACSGWVVSSDFRVGRWVVRPSCNTLSQNGASTRLEPKVMGVLVCLASQPGETLSKETILKAVWPDTFVTEDVLTHSISELRRVFEDDARRPRVIETIPKRGYRLVAAISPVNGPITNNDAAVLVNQPEPSERNWRFAWLSIGGLVLLCALSLGLNIRDFRMHIFGDNPRIHSLAVLPLENLSDDPAQKYFSYGVTEELITDLAKMSGVKVISHTSTARYENKPLSSLPQIARELNVDGIVEGAVQRSGNQVRITVQLIYAPEDKHLWAESYDRDFRDVLALQSNVAAAIVAQIQTQVAGRKPVSTTTRASANLQALEAYLHGNYSFTRMGAGDGVEGYRSAIGFFKQAIAADPNFAGAYLGLAHTYDAQFDWRPTEIMPLEKAALAKALELDPASADAHLMNATIKLSYDCDLPGAEKEIKETLRLNPSLADAHEILSDYLRIVGREEESIQETKRAQELDPEGMHELRSFMATGQYDRAIDQLGKHLELQPNDGFAYIDGGLIDAYAFKGMRRESVEALARMWTLFGFKAIGEGVARAYRISGYEEAYRYSAQQLQLLYAAGKLYKPDYIARWYARSGDREQALKWLEIAFVDYNHCMGACNQHILRDPDFAFLKSDHQFQKLLERAELRQ
jgi:TolB-like protein/DNA-binding winged helix-turn-helix (wHTH) protein